MCNLYVNPEQKSILPVVTESLVPKIQCGSLGKGSMCCVVLSAFICGHCDVYLPLPVLSVQGIYASGYLFSFLKGPNSMVCGTHKSQECLVLVLTSLSLILLICEMEIKVLTLITSRSYLSRSNRMMLGDCSYQKLYEENEYAKQPSWVLG
jgi:hypothetical protein